MLFQDPNGSPNLINVFTPHRHSRGQRWIGVDRSGERQMVIELIEGGAQFGDVRGKDGGDASREYQIGVGERLESGAQPEVIHSLPQFGRVRSSNQHPQRHGVTLAHVLQGVAVNLRDDAQTYPNREELHDRAGLR